MIEPSSIMPKQPYMPMLISSRDKPSEKEKEILGSQHSFSLNAGVINTFAGGESAHGLLN